MKNSLKKETMTQKLGDKVESVGEKISHAGAKKVGNSISRAGDRLEHSKDQKPTSSK
ncbi:MAG: hypothetical protein H7328_08000 [Bdellovibrio sp.]|nr:hypothetical protein [Bdellovibrio sp.]